MTLAAYALFASPNRRAKIGRRDLIIGGGILFPVVTTWKVIDFAG
jgi:hypothetical protein